MSEVQTPVAQVTPQAPVQNEVKAETPATAAGTTVVTGAEAQTQATSETQPKSPVVPEKYDLKLPEGATLDQKAIDEISAFAKEKGLSQEAAQAVLEREHSLISGLQQKAEQEWQAKKDQWLKDATGDKEFGGDNLKLSAEVAHRALKRFDSTGKLAEMLETSGFGNHPEVIRFMWKIGQAMSEDQLVIPGAQSGGKKPIEEVFYGKQT